MPADTTYMLTFWEQKCLLCEANVLWPSFAFLLGNCVSISNIIPKDEQFHILVYFSITFLILYI